MRIAINYNLQNPNVCTICEEKPLGDEVIDCERYTPNSPRYRLNGRKYVCLQCGREIAKRLGFVSVQEVDEVQAFLKLAVDELAELRKVNEAQSTLLSAVYVAKPIEELNEDVPLPLSDEPKKKAGRPRKVVTDAVPVDEA